MSSNLYVQRVDVMKISKELMGQVVRVKKLLKRDVRNEYPEVKIEGEYAPDTFYFWKEMTLSYPRSAWIIGVRFLKEGKYIPSDISYTEEGYEGDEAALRVDRCVPALMVCFWPTTKPFFCPLDGWDQDGKIPPPLSPGSRYLPDLNGYQSGEFIQEPNQEKEG